LVVGGAAAREERGGREVEVRARIRARMGRHEDARRRSIPGGGSAAWGPVGEAQVDEVEEAGYRRLLGKMRVWLVRVRPVWPAWWWYRRRARSVGRRVGEEQAQQRRGGELGGGWPALPVSVRADSGLSGLDLGLQVGLVLAACCTLCEPGAGSHLCGMEEDGESTAHGHAG
jgi:hypothetical protein